MISKSAKIHPTALVSEDATIGENVEIGPFCIIESGVTIGDNCKLTSHVVIKNNTVIGTDNKIYSFAVIGEVNQDLKYNGEDTKVIIGNNNSIREHCTIHIGTVSDITSGETIIGNNNLLMVNSHVAHDCVIGNNAILANNVALAGHVTIDDFAIIGGLSGVHQFVTIGAHVMVGACSMVSQDVPPFVLCHGNHAQPVGVNYTGIGRRNFDTVERNAIRKAYDIIYNNGLNLENAIIQLEHLAANFTSISFFLSFFKKSNRGIIRRKGNKSE